MERFETAWAKCTTAADRRRGGLPEKVCAVNAREKRAPGTQKSVANGRFANRPVRQAARAGGSANGPAGMVAPPVLRRRFMTIFPRRTAGIDSMTLEPSPL